MSDAIPASAVRRAVAVHDELIVALYGGTSETIPGARLVSNPWIEEPEWNHAGALALDASALDATLASLARSFGSIDRRPALLIDPLSEPENLETELRRRGWCEAFRHAGLVWPEELPLKGVGWPAGATLAETRSPAPGIEDDSVGEAPDLGDPGCPREPLPSMEAFAAVFEASFAETAGGGLSRGYREAFPAAMARPVAGVEVVHTLVRVGGEPAGVGSRALTNGVAGLYNLGVAPRFRRLGLGGAITLHRVAAARAAGAEVIYLLTEDPRVEAAQRRRGFVRAFELLGLVAPL
jgi:GNAT superfamily N-acetyltransferase